MLSKRFKRILQIFFTTSIIISIFCYLRLPADYENQRHVPDMMTCSPLTSLVYIKMIKCASTSIAKVIRKFGYTNNLSFVLPHLGKIYIGWPYSIDASFYRPPKNGKFHLLCEHCIFENRQRMEALMAGGRKTLFVTSLRQPYSQFKSTLNYYNVLNISHVPTTQGDIWRIREFVNNIEKYDKFYKSEAAREKRYCIPDGLSMTKNLMSFNLGLKTGFNGSPDLSDDFKYVNNWLDELGRNLDVVLIYEHLYESLVLLRRSMCWKLRDIILPMANQLPYKYKNVPDSLLENKYKQWSRVDYLLYTRFNLTLWHRIQQQSADFFLEVAQLERTTRLVNSFCADAANNSKAEVLAVAKSLWDEEFWVDANFCRLLNDDLLPILQGSYSNQAPTDLREPTPIRNTC